MNTLLTTLRAHAATQPNKPAIDEHGDVIAYGELQAMVADLSARLRHERPHVIAIIADNGADWIVADLAAYAADIPIVPIPLFFSDAQIEHALHQASVSHILTDRPDLVARYGDGSQNRLLNLHWIRLAATTGSKKLLPKGACKISFTSGTTGSPKGVCLTREAIETVTHALRDASKASTTDRHLCVLPLSLLLENVAGVYVPLLAGATVMISSLKDVGLTGSSGLDVTTMIAALSTRQASTTILVPQMLEALVSAGLAGMRMPRQLRFLAVGGGTVSSRLLQAAAKLGLAVYQGYGLSECASVVALNRQNANRPGSVGKPLAHMEIAFADDNEILLRMPFQNTYLDQTMPMTGDGYLPTGDIGWRDEDGYLYITGRKKNLFITSFGRNVSPEWIEGELTAEPSILQAAVFGEARPSNIAILCASGQADTDSIGVAVALANQRLPDYARIERWFLASEPFSIHNNQATANGRLRRENIAAAYRDQLDRPCNRNV